VLAARRAAATTAWRAHTAHETFRTELRTTCALSRASSTHRSSTRRYVVEIGPGQAALTRHLLERAGHIVALEIDRDLAASLRTNFPERLSLIIGDALDFDWSAISERCGSSATCRPTSPPLLFALVPLAGRVRDQHFMLQKEVVDRMVASPGSRTYGRLSVMLQSRYRLTKLFDVGPGAFRPAPEVTSSIVRMQPLPVALHPAADARRFAQVVSAAFGQRRKTLRNALAELASIDVIRAAAVDPQARAETLSVDDFARLTAAVAAAQESD
jgi:16S rRNA (adenine1518-N6/adenine1519-N6)-dimethyltransferase